MGLYFGTTPQPWWVLVNADAGWLDAVYHASKPSGGRLASIAMSSGVGEREPMYHGIFVERAGPAWELKVGLSPHDLEKYVAEQRQNGFFPRLVAAHRRRSYPHTETFAVMVEQGAPESRVELVWGMELKAKIRADDPKRQQEFLRSCAVYGATTWKTDAFLRYALLWEDQPDVGKLRWNAFSGRDPNDSNAEGDTWPEQFQALVQGFWRPDIVSPSEPGQGFITKNGQVQLAQFSGRIYSIWRDEALNAWSLQDLGGEAALAQLLAGIESFRMPIRIQVAGPPGPQQRFTVMVAASDELIARVPTVNHVKPTASLVPSGKKKVVKPTGPPFADCDAYVLDILKRENIRCAQLALAYDGRLVHAAAITHAEPGYPPVTNTHVMRVGSISKALTGLAVAHGWSKGLLDPFNDSVASLLEHNNRFTVVDEAGMAARRLVHFLSHSSNLVPQGAALGPMDAVSIANDADHPEITDQDWVRYFLTKHPDAANLFTNPPPNNAMFNPPPGPPRPVADYNGAGFWIAGQCLANKQGLNTLAAAMKASNGFFGKLKMERPRLTHFNATQAFEQQAVEVLYHDIPGYAHAHVPLVKNGPHDYGWGPYGPWTYSLMEAVSGASVGSWALAAVDLARIFSLWDVKPNPLFDASPDPETIARATRYLYSTTHGLGVVVLGHFDQFPDVEPRVIGHNGAILGCRSTVMRRTFKDPQDVTVTHSLVVAITFNGGSFDDTLVGFGTDLGLYKPAKKGVADEIFARALAGADQHGWPDWNLFDEVDLPTYDL
jgi:CubicO group peptidase (beta-lactamase class C family)